MSNDKHSSPAGALDSESLELISAAIKPAELSAERKQVMYDRLLQRIDPPAPDGTYTIRANEMKWTNVCPGIEMKVLRKDTKANNQTALWRLQAGAVFPRHGHSVEEECLVLEGEIKVGDHVVRKGDMHIVKKGEKHPDTTSEHGALLMIRAQVIKMPKVSLWVQSVLAKRRTALRDNLA